MNTQGWIRGLITHNSPLDKFVDFVCNTISQEFGLEVCIEHETNAFVIKFDNYRVNLSESDVTLLQKKSPYALDKVLLESLKEQGLEFDVQRSQYIRYCCGLI